MTRFHLGDRSLLACSLPIVAALIAERTGLFEQLLGLNQAQGISLTILIIAASLWVTEFIPLFVTSFIILLLQMVWLTPAINSIPDSTVIKKIIFLSPFFSNIILLFLGGFVLSAVLHKYGLDLRIAHLILKKTGNKPSRVMIGIMLVSSVLSAWMSNTATAAMMFAIILPIIARIPSDNNFGKALALCIPFSCNLGGIATPIGTPPNAIVLGYLEKSGFHISFLHWMIGAIPFVLLFLFFLWVILLKLYPPGDLEIEFEPAEGVTRKMTKEHYVVIGIFILTCIGWLTSKHLHPLSTGEVSLIPLIFCFGFGLLKGSDFRQLSWDVLFMLGGGLTLGVGLKASGLTAQIVGFIPTGVDFIVILGLMGLLSTVMTTFMSNTATANLLVPIAVSLGGDVALIAVTVAFMCSTAMALPVSTPPNAIAFGSGILEAKNMIIPGLMVTVFTFLIIFFAGPFYWNFIGLVG
jgi:sodium-dependent dicarboxylate transporter 2/3/5